MADNGKAIAVNVAPTKAQRASAKEALKVKHERMWEEEEAFNENQENWEYVEVPEVDLFDKPFGKISINLIDYHPGKHFVRPDIAKEMRGLLRDRFQSDMRILRPTKDKKMLEIMARNGKPLTTATVGGQVSDFSNTEYRN